MKEDRQIEHHHHNYNIDGTLKGLFTFLIILIVVTTILTMAQANENVYTQCTNSCSRKHFEGLEIGIDNQDNNKEYVIEFDRTQCLDSCNEMYLELKEDSK